MVLVVPTTSQEKVCIATTNGCLDVCILQCTPRVSRSYWELVAKWACIRSLHLWMHYQTFGVYMFQHSSWLFSIQLFFASLAQHDATLFAVIITKGL
jgi:hypothetical protein